MGLLIIKEYTALFSWRLLRERSCAWYYLERDGKIIAEGGDPRALLEVGLYR